MRRSQAERYARWAAGMAVLLTAAVAGVYFYRSGRSTVPQTAPPVVPPTVQQRSQEFSFSQKIEDRTLFTVRASQATQYTEGSRSLLEDVWITIHGRAGKRFDNLHTRECSFEPESGRITCAGEVRIVLESAEEARQRPGERAIQIDTSAVRFERSTGVGSTDAAVQFRFPYGHGRGAGLTYRSLEATVRLHRDVELTLTHAGAGRPVAEAVTLTGSALEYNRDTRRMTLLAPVRVRQGTRELTAGELILEFDSALRAERLVAAGHPALRSAEPGGRLVLSAAEFTAQLSPEGWVQQWTASRGVSGLWETPAGSERLTAGQVTLQLEETGNQPRRMTISGDARVVSAPRDASRGRRTLETAALRLDFIAASRRPGAPRQLSGGETLAPATLELSAGGETTRVRSDRLAAQFDAGNRVRELRGAGNSRITRSLPGGAEQRLESRDFTMAFDAQGQWSELAPAGAVRFGEGERSAAAERARMVRATDTVTLSGGAAIADATTRTSAESIVFGLHGGELRAQGNVRTTVLAGAGHPVANLAAQPAHISAAALYAEDTTGRAAYTGRARLWQGDAVIEADAMDLLRDARRLEARGDVRAVFPQPGRGAGGGVELWRVRSGELIYWSEENRARLEGNVLAESQIGRIRAKTLDLFLSEQGGTQQIARAVAAGGVTIQTGTGRQERRGTAERADYVSAEGKFTLTGGQPTLFDALRGTTTGRQLTFFLADDRILVDSEQGASAGQKPGREMNRHDKAPGRRTQQELSRTEGGRWH